MNDRPHDLLARLLPGPRAVHPRALAVALCLAAACRGPQQHEAAPAARSDAVPPDRLAAGERLADSETAFGLTLPRGLRLVRHFADSATLAGRLPFDDALSAIREQLLSGGAELRGDTALFAGAYVKGDPARRLLRVEITRLQSGSQVRLRDITPPPVAIGLSEAERWQRAGRNPDGSLQNELQMY